MTSEQRIEELIRTSVLTLRQRWPEDLNAYSDRVVALVFNDFYFSADAGNNDARFPEWFSLLPDYALEEGQSK